MQAQTEYRWEGDVVKYKMSFILNIALKYETNVVFRKKTVTVSCVFESKRFCFIVKGDAIVIGTYKFKNLFKANYSNDVSKYYDVIKLNHIDFFVH